MEHIFSILSNDKGEWDAKVETLNKLRRLLVGGAASFPSFVLHVCKLKEAFCALVRRAAHTFERPQIH